MGVLDGDGGLWHCIVAHHPCHVPLCHVPTACCGGRTAPPFLILFLFLFLWLLRFSPHPISQPLLLYSVSTEYQSIHRSLPPTINLLSLCPPVPPAHIPPLSPSPSPLPPPNSSAMILSCPYTFLPICDFDRFWRHLVQSAIRLVIDLPCGIMARNRCIMLGSMPDSLTSAQLINHSSALLPRRCSPLSSLFSSFSSSSSFNSSSSYSSISTFSYLNLTIKTPPPTVEHSMPI